MTSMRKSRLSYSKQNRLIDHFVAGATARTVATVRRIRERDPERAEQVLSDRRGARQRHAAAARGDFQHVAEVSWVAETAVLRHLYPCR